MDDHEADQWVQDEAEPAPEIRLLQKEIASLKRRLLEGRNVEALIRAAVAEHYTKPPELIMPPDPVSCVTIENEIQQIPIAHISDTQLGKVTMTYDAAEGAKRLHLYVQKVVEIIEIKRSGSQIDELHLYLGGDIVEGEYGNYPSQPYDTESSVIRQAMKEAPDIFEALIYYLLKHVKTIHVYCVPGNHGRGASFKQTRHTETNWDRVFYWLLRDRLLGSDEKPDKEMRKRIPVFFVPEGDQFWAIDRVWNWGNLLVHGDQIRGWAGIPFYGVQKKSHGWADAMPKDWDHLLFGHFHTYASGTINFRRWFCNGTTESSNTYALEALAAAGEPSQRLLFMTANKGVISDHQIFLEETRLPIMARKLAQAASELGKEEVQRILDVLTGGEGRLDT